MYTYTYKEVRPDGVVPRGGGEFPGGESELLAHIEQNAPFGATHVSIRVAGNETETERLCLCPNQPCRFHRWYGYRLAEIALFLFPCEEAPENEPPTTWRSSTEWHKADEVESAANTYFAQVINGAVFETVFTVEAKSEREAADKAGATLFPVPGAFVRGTRRDRVHKAMIHDDRQPLGERTTILGEFKVLRDWHGEVRTKADETPMPTLAYRATLRPALDGEICTGDLVMVEAGAPVEILRREAGRLLVKSDGATPLYGWISADGVESARLVPSTPRTKTDAQAAAETELAKGQGGPYLIWAVPGKSLYLGGSVGKRADMPKGAVVVENGFGSVFEAGRRFDQLACEEMETNGFRLSDDDGTEYEFAPVCELWAGRNAPVSFEVVGRRRAPRAERPTESPTEAAPAGCLFDLGRKPKAEKPAPAPSLFREEDCELFEAPAVPTMRKGMTVDQMLAWKPRMTGRAAGRQELFAPGLA